MFTELFAATGDPLDAVLPLRRVEPIARYRFADGTVLTYDVGPRRAARPSSTARSGRGTGAAWQRVLDRGERIWDAVEHPVLGAELTGLGFARQLSRLGRPARGRARAHPALHSPGACWTTRDSG